MLIYLDESFDLRARYMCLGALFVPDHGISNRQLEAIKESYRRLKPGRIFSDVKYSKSGEYFTSQVCREIVELFLNQPGWFRALVVDTAQPDFAWEKIGGRDFPRGFARSRAYGRLAAALLERNLRGKEDAVLLADSMTEGVGDDFVQHMLERFGPEAGALDGRSRGSIRYVQRVDTSLQEYQLGQVCDVLLGIITGDLVPPTNRNKLCLIRYAKEALGVPGFGPEFWMDSPESTTSQCSVKFHVHHWQATNKA